MEIKSYIIPTTWLPADCEHGYGNGYVGVPAGHPWFGIDYNNIPAEVHGGLTYSDNHAPKLAPDGYWWIGFDTNHYQDNKHNCNAAYVQAQVDSLKQQALEAKQVVCPTCCGKGHL